MMLQYKLVAALIAALAVLGLYAWGQQGHYKARQASNEARVIATQRDTAVEALRLFKQAAARDRELEAKRADVAQKQRGAAEARAKELSDALKAAPDWAARPVPDGVWDNLGPRAPAPSASARQPASRLPSPQPPR